MTKLFARPSTLLQGWISKCKLPYFQVLVICWNSTRECTNWRMQISAIGISRLIKRILNRKQVRSSDELRFQNGENGCRSPWRINESHLEKGVVIVFCVWNGSKFRGRFTFGGACKFCVRFDEQRHTFACYVLQTA